MKRILAALIAVLTLLTTALMGGCSCSGNDTPVPLAIDNHRGVVISLQHPSSFTYNEGKAGYGILGQDAITHNGTLQGEYDISFNCCKLHENTYDTVDAFAAQFKGCDFYQEPTISGTKAYAKQFGDTPLEIIVPYSSQSFVEILVKLPAGGTSAYQNIYNSARFQDMLKSIQIQATSEAKK